MIQKKIFQLLLSPFSFLYGIIVSIYFLPYDIGFLKGSKFSLPVISIGNLSIGGTGKSPHIEYLLDMLKDYIDVAVLSRGYRRNSMGFKIVTFQDDARTVGDEPFQFLKKYKDVIVAVCENRALGIPQILQHQPNAQTVLLDDGFQHRSVTPGLNILLTAYDNLFTRDFLLPSGRLREWRSGYKRTDIIIVTKCPTDMDTSQKEKIIAEISPLHHQKIFFSYYQYLSPYDFNHANHRIHLDDEIDIVLLSAIAETAYLYQYLSTVCKSITEIEFADHHYFDKNDVEKIYLHFKALASKRKLILTTEKDAVRLELVKDILQTYSLPIYILPIKVKFLESVPNTFDDCIKNYLLDFKA